MAATESPLINTPETLPVPEIPAGRLVIQYLQNNQDGATATEILEHLRCTIKTGPPDLDKVVESILENGTALGFLERKGSYYMNWVARQRSCGKRKRRGCSRRRQKRRIRKRSCCCRKKRKRKCVTH